MDYYTARSNNHNFASTNFDVTAPYHLFPLLLSSGIGGTLPSIACEGMERDGRSLPPSRPQVIESSKTSLTHTLHRFRLWCCLQTCTHLPKCSPNSRRSFDVDVKPIYISCLFNQYFCLFIYDFVTSCVTRWGYHYAMIHFCVSLLIHIFIIIVVRLLFP